MKASGLRVALYIMIGLASVTVVLYLIQGQVDAGRHTMIPSRPTPPGGVSILFFHSEECPHCALANPVMQDFQTRYPKTGWFVVEITDSMDPRLHQQAWYWLRAAGRTQMQTPIIVIGANQPKPTVLIGFKDAKSSREPIENSLRSLLGLPPIQLEAESINLPFVGLQIVSDMARSRATELLALIGGIHPAAMGLFLLFLFVPWRCDLRSALGLGSGLLCAIIISEWLFSYPTLRDAFPSIYGVVARILAGLCLLFWSARRLARFFVQPPPPADQTVDKPRRLNQREIISCFLVLVLASCFDQSLTSWTQRMIVTAFGPLESLTIWLLYAVVPGFAVILIALAYRAFGEWTPRAARVASFACALVTLHGALYLLLAHAFDGYGSFWL